MVAPLKVLVVDDEPNIRRVLSVMLKNDGHEVVAAETILEAKQYLKTESIHVVVTDLRLKQDDGMDLLKWIRIEKLPCPVIILTAHGSVDSAVDAMKRGAFDYLSKPFEKNELLSIIRKAKLTYELQNGQHLQMLGTDDFAVSIVGKNEKLMKVFEAIGRVSVADSTVLITGESGTGKELIAQEIHDRSPRSSKPLIKINCAAIPVNLLESELFGYEKGAFTGAMNSKPGRFELADTGTLFLDEIGEMGSEMQVKLLRVLQDKCFERVGGLRTIHCDVRLITATNRDLVAMVEEGKFREDLFYRLNVIPLAVPPLRERPDDIPLLIAHFLEMFAKKFKRDVPKLASESLEVLTQYSWPGNIRQLENALERILVLHEGDTIETKHLPDELLNSHDEVKGRSKDDLSLKEQVKKVTRKVERRVIEKALEENDQNVTQAAKSLDISRKGLQLKLKELGIR